MSPNHAETSLIGIKLDSDQLPSRSVIKTYTNIRVRVVAGNRHQLSRRVPNRVVPPAQVLPGPGKEVCKHQIRITSVGPQSIKEHDDRIYLSRIGEKVINLNAICRGGLPVLRFRRVGDERQSATGLLLCDDFLGRTAAGNCRVGGAGNQQQTIATRGADLVSVYEHDAIMNSVKRHG